MQYYYRCNKSWCQFSFAFWSNTACKDVSWKILPKWGFTNTKRLFFDAIKDNPYIKSPQAQLGYLYFDIEEFDSAYYYAKDAFNGIPNNNVHRDIFFKTLIQRKDTLELKESFELLLEIDPTNSSHWLGYLDSRYQIVGRDDPEILKLIPRFENQFPEFDKRVIDGIRVISKSNLQDLSLGAAFANLADQYYEDGEYLLAADHYEFAIERAEFEYAYYENAAISYYLAEKYESNSIILQSNRWVWN